MFYFKCQHCHTHNIDIAGFARDGPCRGCAAPMRLPVISRMGWGDALDIACLVTMIVALCAGIPASMSHLMVIGFVFIAILAWCRFRGVDD